MWKMCLKQLRQRLKKLTNGEISIYLSLVFTLIISLVLTVISVARGAALQVVYECAVESSLLSVFGQYNRELLDRYDVFFIDLSYLSNSPDPSNLEARLNEYFDDNFHPENGTSFLFYSDILDVEETNVSLTEYELATDRFGEPFARQVTEYMSNLVGVSDVQDMLNLVDIWDAYDLGSNKFDELRDSVSQGVTYSEEDTWEQTKIKKDLVAIMYPSYDLVVFFGTDIGHLSQESIAGYDTLLLRSKQQGVGNMTEFDFEPAENVYFSEYVMQKMGNYIDPKDDTKLKYEVEYIICGNDSDVVNVQIFAKYIYAVRGIADYLSLNMATDKVEKVRGVAETLSAIIKVPEEVITQVILLGWAAVEAVTDVQMILKGKKVPLIKSSDQINVSINGLLNAFSDTDKLIGDSSGTDEITEGEIPSISLGYSDYLRLFLYLTPTIVKTYRTMDMIEADLRISGTGNEYFRFDVCADKIKAIFSVETGFDFRYTTEKKYSFY